jgi:hypothetical protein
MPPEQGQGLLDVVDDRLGFSAHRYLFAGKWDRGRARQCCDHPAFAFKNSVV